MANANYSFLYDQQGMIPADISRGYLQLATINLLEYDSHIQYQLADLLKVIQWKRENKLPVFILIDGDSGKGKTGLALQLARIMNELRGHKFRVGKHYRLDKTSQLTSSVIAKEFLRGETFIQDEFPLNAPRINPSPQQLSDIVEFFNTIRTEEIDFIAIAQYLKDLHSSVHDKFNLRIRTKFAHHNIKTIEAKVELKIKEEDSDDPRWVTLQRLWCGFGNPEDHATVELIKKKATRTEGAEITSYSKSKDSRLSGYKFERAEIIYNMLANGEVQAQRDLSAQDVAIYAMIHFGNTLSSINALLNLTSSNDKNRTSMIKKKRDSDLRNNRIRPAVTKVINEVNKHLKQEVKS